MVASCQDARARRRTERRRMHVGVTQPVLRQPAEVRRIDRRSITTELSEASVVQDNEERIGRAIFRPQRRAPRRLGFADGAAHAARETGAWPVFLQCHANFSSLTFAMCMECA